jgi:hypothetical protein
VAILTPAPINFQQKIRSELAEALRLNFGDIFPTILHLRVTLGGTLNPGPPPTVTLPTPGNDIFRIPGDYSLLVGEIRGHIALNELSQESTTAPTNTGLLNIAGVRNRVVAKALNARMVLVNADRDNLKFVETDIANSANPLGISANLCLANLLPAAGGSPIKLIGDGDVMPLIVPGNERIKLTVALNDENASLGQTEYGLTLMGAFVRSRGS